MPRRKVDHAPYRRAAARLIEWRLSASRSADRRSFTQQIIRNYLSSGDRAEMVRHDVRTAYSPTFAEVRFLVCCSTTPAAW